MNESTQEGLHRFTLFSKKTVTLREPKIGHTRTAAQVAGKKAGDNQAYLNALMQEEVTKLLIVHVDDKKLKESEKENLDNIFSVKEYGQVLQAVQMLGGEDAGKPTMEIETSGN